MKNENIILLYYILILLLQINADLVMIVGIDFYLIHDKLNYKI